MIFILTGFLVPGKTAGKLEVYDTTSGVPVGPWDIAAGTIARKTALSGRPNQITACFMPDKDRHQWAGEKSATHRLWSV